MQLRLSNKFYRKEAIEEAINAFKGVCSCKIADNSFVVELNAKSGSEEKISNEFCNFVLGITKDKMLF